MRFLFTAGFLVWEYFHFIMIVGQNIAQEKCREYSKAVYEEKIVPVTGMKSNMSTCASIANPLVVGGTRAKRQEFPHMALLGFGRTANSELLWLCGGSLISEKHVLTAAHCLNSTFGSLQRIKLGAIKQDSQENEVQEMQVGNCVVYPGYKETVNYNDIAICPLKTTVKFTGYVRPACLNTKNDLSIAKAQAIGFGKTDFYASEMNQELLKVDLDIIDRETCKNYTYLPSLLPENITISQICAGSLKEGDRDTCQGDSGGPLQILLEDPYCMYNLVGVTSFGRFCGMEYSPGIYTNISYYVKWIEETVWT